MASDILVVDDDRAQCQLVARILAERGYRVDTASDARDALRVAANREYSVAVLDYEMPEMDGVELFQRLREMQPAVVGIFVTAFTTLDTVYPAIASGVERVLPKPVDAGELVSLVQRFAGSP